MTERFQVDVLERTDRELVLRLTAIDGNATAFYVQRNFAMALALHAECRDSPLTRDVARQLGYEGNLHDDYDDFTALCGSRTPLDRAHRCWR